MSHRIAITLSDPQYFSLSSCLGCCLHIRAVGNIEDRIFDDSARFPAVGTGSDNIAMVSPVVPEILNVLNTSPRIIANRLLLSPPSQFTAPDSRVEWAYAFDVHTNAFFPLFLALYVAQLFILPVILRNNWLCLWLGNTLYLAA